MMPEENVLWQKISSFPLDDNEASFRFSERLAVENGWDRAYTLSVIEEYRRFIFLCCVSDSGVTPSDPVDQAWHLHLTFTRSYWVGLCRDTIGKEIHHNPTKGGASEAKKFNSFYDTSRQLYIDKFNSEPPSDIWHDNRTRFTDIKFQRVNLNKYWLIPKPRMPKKQGIVQLNLLVLAVFMFALSENTIAGIIMVVLITSVIAMAIYYNENENKRGNGCGGAAGCGGDSGAGNYSANSHHTSHHDGGHQGFGHGDNGDAGCGSADSGCSSGCSSGCGSGCGGGGD